MAMKPSTWPMRSRGLEKRVSDALRDIYRQLTPWQKAQVARHPDRPHCLDYVATLFSDFTPLAGDRSYGDDSAIVGGFARFRGERGRLSSVRRRGPTPRAV